MKICTLMHIKVQNLISMSLMKVYEIRGSPQSFYLELLVNEAALSCYEGVLSCLTIKNYIKMVLSLGVLAMSQPLSSK